MQAMCEVGEGGGGGTQQDATAQAVNIGGDEGRRTATGGAAHNFIGQLTPRAVQRPPAHKNLNK